MIDMKPTIPPFRRTNILALAIVAALATACLSAASALFGSDGTLLVDDQVALGPRQRPTPTEDARPPVSLASRASLADERVASEPRAWLVPAPRIEFPADPDCNSPCFWHEGQLHLFTSNQRPSRSLGPDLEQLGAPVPSVFDDGAQKLRWIEAVHLREDGVLFGLYHREEYLGECPDREYFTVPDIGVARSRDLGRTWTDLGIVLQDHGVSRSCDTANKFFAGGVGDPSWAIDRVGGHAYIFYSSYTDPLSNQGVQFFMKGKSRHRVVFERPAAASSASRMRANGTEVTNMSPLRVSANHRFLVTEDGRPFFWLGDTAWRLSILAPDEVDVYMENRVRHAFNVIQVHPGFKHADYAGNLPFLDGDPGQPNEAFWRHVDDILAKARAHGVYVALVPMWGQEYAKAFEADAEKARRFGRWIGSRYASHSHVVWIVSGEYDGINNFRLPISAEQKAVINAAAEGLREGHRGTQLMTIHPGWSAPRQLTFTVRVGWISTCCNQAT